jgi:hypothetical protein
MTAGALRHAGTISYPHGGGLTTAGRASRERVRLASADLIWADASGPEVPGNLHSGRCYHPYRADRRDVPWDPLPLGFWLTDRLSLQPAQGRAIGYGM